jgi:2-methylaconitate cis-trans-isomerase PrpF
MPVVCVRADDLGLTGYEEPHDIEANAMSVRGWSSFVWPLVRS